MKTVKRIEIIIDESHARFVTNLLDQRSISGYSVIRNVTGKGDRGVRDGDGLTTVFDNVYILIACDPGQVELLQPDLRKLLRDYGGVCLVSDAHWLIH